VTARIYSSYYASYQATPQFCRFWDEGHNQTRLGTAAFAGMMSIAKEEPDRWDKDELLQLVRYVEESIFTKIIDNFQTYTVELIAAIFTQRPEMVPNSKFDTRLAFDFASIEDLRTNIVETLATKHAFMNIIDLDDELRQKYSFSLFMNKFRRLRVRRMVEMRNVIVHNRGIINRTFLRKAAAKADILGAKVNPPSGHPN
jgi:hypothetical protein